MYIALADGFELYISFGLIDGSIDYILIGSQSHSKEGPCMYMAICMYVLADSGRTKWKDGCAVLWTGDLPQNWPQKKQSGVSIYNTVTIVLFCKFVLAKHDEVITLSAAGVAQSFSLVPW